MNELCQPALNVNSAEIEAIYNALMTRIIKRQPSLVLGPAGGFALGSIHALGWACGSAIGEASYPGKAEG